MRSYQRYKVLVSLNSGEGIEGILDDCDDRALELLQACHIDAGGKRSPVDGHIIIHRSDVRFIQTLT